MFSKQKSLRRMILAAMFLALALVLPFFTGQIPQIGNALCPMHIPVLLCGFFCGPWYALFPYTTLFRSPLLFLRPMVCAGGGRHCPGFALCPVWHAAADAQGHCHEL